jgi:aminoglycoside N3'-acetyltransferase
VPHDRSVAEITADLRQLGVQAGDTVMVHASLRRIGPVEGRAAGVVQALDDAVGHHGTVLMNIGPENDELFDPLTTPVDSDIGVLAEVFRTTPGTLVSNHPEGRFGARGHMAARLTQDVPWNDYYGPNSPLERLVKLRGKVLRLGADFESLTVLHYAEYLAPVPAKRRVVRSRQVLGQHGPEVRTIECLDDSDGIVDWSGPDYFALIVKEYLATQRATRGLVGGAESDLIDAGDLVAFGAAWMGEHFT